MNLEAKVKKMELKLIVEGMTCASCVARVEKALKNVDGVKEVTVNLLTNSAQVKIDEPVDPSMLLAAVEKAGYKAKLPKTSATSVKLAVTGMHCASCVRTIETNLKKLPGVVDVSINLSMNSANVVLEQAAIPPTKIVEKIAKQEKFKINDKAIESLYNISHGDLRRVINILQASASISKKIDENTIYEIIAEAKPADIKEILELALKGSFLEARNKLLDVMLKQGFSGLDIIKIIQREIWNLDIKEEEKIKLIEKCGEIEFRLVEGSDDFIQLEALLASFILANK